MDEYLLLGQVGYLISADKEKMDKLVLYNKLPCETWQGRRLICLSDLKKYVRAEMTKYPIARKYLSADDKYSFWSLQKKKFYNSGIVHDESMLEYLTVSQVAYLFGLSRQTIHGMVRRGAMQGRFLELSGYTRPVLYIRADEVKKYIRKHDRQYTLALEYFKVKNKFAFWNTHAAGYEENWVKVNRERSRFYYEKKVQKRHRRANPGGSGTGKRAGASAG